MPVWKYRSVEEMPEAWTMNRHVPLGRRIRALMSLAPISGPLDMPRGVRKFRSIEELTADRSKYERERIERIQSRNREQK
jgi:hypothetical protein